MILFLIHFKDKQSTIVDINVATNVKLEAKYDS